MRLPFDGTYVLTQKFGERPDYYKNFGLSGHEGVDWGCPTGTPILAVASGQVVRNNFSAKDYGKYVVIWHETLNLGTWYCHLQSFNVAIGDRVQEGQQIGISNNTGNTNGSHLHFGLVQTDSSGYRLHKDNGYQGFIDPMPYLSGTKPSPEKPQTSTKKELGTRVATLETQINQLQVTVQELKKVIDQIGF